MVAQVPLSELGQLGFIERPRRGQQHEVTARGQADQGEILRQLVPDRFPYFFFLAGRLNPGAVPPPGPPPELFQTPDVPKGVSPYRAELGVDPGRVIPSLFLPPE